MRISVPGGITPYVSQCLLFHVRSGIYMVTSGGGIASGTEIHATVCSMKSGKVCLCFLVLSLSLVSFCAPTENKELSPEDEHMALLKDDELANLSDLKDLKTDEVALEDFEEDKTDIDEPFKFEVPNKDNDELDDDQGDDVDKSDVDGEDQTELQKHELEVEEMQQLIEQETKLEAGAIDEANIKEYSFEDMAQGNQEETEQEEDDKKDVSELADMDIVASEDLEGEDNAGEEDVGEEEEKEEEEEEMVMQFRETEKLDTKVDPQSLPPPKVSSFEPIPMPTDFESYDTDRNDFIDIEELVAVTGAWENVLEAFKVCDKNDDDLIDRDEFRQAPWDLAGKPPAVV